MFEEIKPFSIPFIPGKVLYTFHMVDCHVVHDALFFWLFFLLLYYYNEEDPLLPSSLLVVLLLLLYIIKKISI